MRVMTHHAAREGHTWQCKKNNYTYRITIVPQKPSSLYPENIFFMSLYHPVVSDVLLDLPCKRGVSILAAVKAGEGSGAQVR